MTVAANSEIVVLNKISLDHNEHYHSQIRNCCFVFQMLLWILNKLLLLLLKYQESFEILKSCCHWLLEFGSCWVKRDNWSRLRFHIPVDWCRASGRNPSWRARCAHACVYWCHKAFCGRRRRRRARAPPYLIPVGMTTCKERYMTGDLNLIFVTTWEVDQ